MKPTIMIVPSEKVDARTFHDLVKGNRHSLICLDPNERIVAGFYLLLEEYKFKLGSASRGAPTGNYALMWVTFKSKGGGLKDSYCLIELQLFSPDCFYENIDPKDIQEIIKERISK